MIDVRLYNIMRERWGVRRDASLLMWAGLRGPGACRSHDSELAPTHLCKTSAIAFIAIWVKMTFGSQNHGTATRTETHA